MRWLEITQRGHFLKHSVQGSDQRRTVLPVIVRRSSALINSFPRRPSVSAELSAPNCPRRGLPNEKVSPARLRHPEPPTITTGRGRGQAAYDEMIGLEGGFLEN